MAETTQPLLAREPVNQEDSKASGVHGIDLPPPTFIPRRYKPRNVGEWTGHLTFASELIVALQPELIVELGTHWGEAYFTFCQTVQEHGLSSLCYAVDHWQGDEHAGQYGEEVFEEVSQYNERLYRQFSYLVRRSFDEALPQFADDSIGLLHIDGLHTYEAVKHDFQNWLPKVKPGGVILLHDICPRHQDFGVWRLWEEIKAEFSNTFEFHHSWGLGVVRKSGGETDGSRLPPLLFGSSPALQEEVRRHYVIYASHLEHLLGRIERLPAPPQEAVTEIRVEVFPRIGGTYSPETCQIRKMQAGEWNTLVFDLRDPNIRGPMRIDPGWEPSFIEVGDITIHSVETGELIWSSPAGARREYQAAGTARTYDDDGSLLVNFGDDPQILLNTPPEVRGPQKLTVTLKVTPVTQAGIEIVRSKLQLPFDEAVRQRNELASELAASKAQLGETTAARDAMRADMERTWAEARATQLALEHTGQQLVERQQVIRGIETSASWRVTAPLRKIMSALRSGPRKTSGS